MSRRKHAELEFGSDSFLDIVANIVGILIILIVVAGVRVSKTPVLAIGLQEGERVAEVEAESSERSPQVAPLPAPPRAEEPPLELVQRAARLDQQIASLDGSLQSTAAAAQAWRSEQESLEQEFASAAQALDDQQQVADADDRQLLTLRRSLDESKQQLEELKVQLVEAIRTHPPAEKIEHTLTPLSQLVEGTELHFRLSGNRVSHVPLEELLERLKGQVERQKEWLIKFNQSQGTVGPVHGYTMAYVVARQKMSLLDELRNGQAMMRIGVSEWKVEPDESLQAESAEEALRAGSQFYRTLLTADPHSTLTFWVYPDSFTLFRQLQSFARQEGFTVAARPLPPGVPIAGSPNGSRSASQ